MAYLINGCAGRRGFPVNAVFFSRDGFLFTPWAGSPGGPPSSGLVIRAAKMRPIVRVRMSSCACASARAATTRNYSLSDKPGQPWFRFSKPRGTDRETAVHPETISYSFCQILTWIKAFIASAALFSGRVRDSVHSGCARTIGFTLVAKTLRMRLRCRPPAKILPGKPPPIDFSACRLPEWC